MSVDQLLDEFHLIEPQIRDRVSQLKCCLIDATALFVNNEETDGGVIERSKELMDEVIALTQKRIDLLARCLPLLPDSLLLRQMQQMLDKSRGEQTELVTMMDNMWQLMRRS